MVYTNTQRLTGDFHRKASVFGHMAALLGMSHVSLPCRDLKESKIFYSQVMGGELVHEIAGCVEYKIEASLRADIDLVGWASLDLACAHSIIGSYGL